MEKQSMDQQRIVIATMTWARDEQEERLLRESLAYLAREQITTFITDGGSGPQFIEFLRRVPNFHIFNAARAGVLPQLKQSLLAAQDSGADFILYTEPDKKLFFEGKLHGFISAAPSDESVGIVLASRSAGSFATFPAFQQYTESVINHLCAEIIGAQVDYTYGPFLFNRQLAGYLDLIADEVGWGWRPYLFGVARRAGYKIVSLVDDYPCLPEQQEDSRPERIYRMRQLSQSIEGLVLSTKVALAHP